MASGKIIKRRKEKVRKVKKGDVTGLENAPSTSPFIKKLASNDRATRESAIDMLNLFLQRTRSLSQLELQKLWKGLFFAMWFSDRPKPQQRLANALSSLVSVVNKVNLWGFIEAFWVIIGIEWEGLDHLRMDKFYMLLRRFLNAILRRLKLEDWNEEDVRHYVEITNRLPLGFENNQKYPVGVTLHIVDIFTDELEKNLFEDIEENDANDEESAEVDNTKLSEEKQQIITDTPIKELYSSFLTLSKTSNVSSIKNKIKNEMLVDERLVQWGVIEKDEEEEHEEEEWIGFD